MQVSVEQLEGLERKLTVSIPAGQVDDRVEQKVSETAKKARLDGFRPGKVPAKVIRQRFGESIRQEIVAEVAQQSFQQAVAQESLMVVGQPSIQPLRDERGADFEFEATFEVYPEVDVCGLDEITIERPVAEVTEADVDAMIEKLRDQQASWNEVQRPAADGDQVNIDYVGTRDGTPFDGGSANGVDLVLGSGRMIEGFEAGIEGCAAGDEKTLELAFPEDYGNEELAGAAVEFEITVNTVSEKVLPEVNEDFYAIFDVNEGGLEAFRQNVRESMEKQLKDAIDGKVKQQVMDALHDQSGFALPRAMVANEVRALKTQTLARVAGGQENVDESLLPDELFTEQAEKRVGLGLILNKVAEQYEIRPDRDRVLEFVNELAESYEDPAEVREYYLGDQERFQQVQSIVVEQSIVERVLEDAEITEKPCSYDEAVQAPGQ